MHQPTGVHACFFSPNRFIPLAVKFMEVIYRHFVIIHSISADILKKGGKTLIFAVVGLFL
jgi:hypothetical protein